MKSPRMPSPPAQPNSRVQAAISEQREAARKQLTSAWRLQMFRVEEALSTGWEQHVQRVFDDRFAALAVRIQRLFEAELAERVRAAAALSPGARGGFAEEFNRACRLLLRAETQRQWTAALLDAADRFCEKAFLFSVGGGRLTLLGARGSDTEADAAAPPATVGLKRAPAAAEAVLTRETVLTPASAGELSAPIASLLGNTSRCALVPVVIRERAAAILVAAGTEMVVNGLEAIAVLAGMAAERRSRAALASPAEEGAAPVAREVDAVHLRARRFARVRVAELLLLHPEQIRKGRAHRRLYAALQEDIDAARAAYRDDFQSAVPALPDYLHLELVKTLANEDPAVLGESYPGALE